MTMTLSTTVNFTLQVEIFEAQAMWEHARHLHAAANGGRLTAIVNQEFIALCGEYRDPDLGECLALIFAHGERPPGIRGDGSSARLVCTASPNQYLLFVADHGEAGTDGLGDGHA